MQTSWILFLLLVPILPIGYAQIDVACVDGSVCDGAACLQHVSAGSGRNWRLLTNNEGGFCTAQTANFDVNASDCVTLTYRTATFGLAPPGPPNTLTLRVLHDNSATIVRTLHNGADLADGTTFEFCFTNDGLAGGVARAGTFRLYIRADRDDIGAYDFDTDGLNNAETNVKGYTRAGVKITSITRSAYPAGTNFAYGRAGDEVNTITTTHSSRFADTGAETIRTKTIRASDNAVIETGATEEIGDGAAPPATTTTQGFTIDNTYDSALVTYGAEFEIIGNAALRAAPWTRIATAGNGAGIIRVSDTLARDANVFDADPRIIFSTNGALTDNGVNTNFEKYNRLEVVDYDHWLLNSRIEKLIRSMTIAVLDDTATVENTQVLDPPDTGASEGKYDSSYTALAGHKATHDTVGSPKNFRATNTDQTKTSVVTHNLSNLYRTDTNGASPFDLQVGTDFEVYNRVESVTMTFRGIGVRDNLLTVTLTVDVRNVADASENSASVAPVGTVYTRTYTTGAAHTATADTIGSQKRVRVSDSGNDNDLNRNDAFGVSSLYFVDSHPQSSGTLVKDDFPTEDEAETLLYIISAANMFAWVHVKGVRKDVEIDTSGSAITFVLRRPDASTAKTCNLDTGTDGWTTVSCDFDPTAPVGTWTWVGTATFNGNSGSNNEDVVFISAFTGNLVIRLLVNHTLLTNTTYQVFARVEKDDAGFTPDTLPQIKVSRVNETNGWEDVLAISNMHNVVDFTETINGSLYRFNWTTPDFICLCNVWVMTTIAGAGIREQQEGVEVIQGDIVNESLETFNQIAPLLVFALLILWAERSKEWLIYLLAIVAGSVAVLATWAEVESLRLILVSATLLLVVRTVMTYNDWKLELEDD